MREARRKSARAVRVHLHEVQEQVEPTSSDGDENSAYVFGGIAWRQVREHHVVSTLVVNICRNCWSSTFKICAPSCA